MSILMPKRVDGIKLTHLLRAGRFGVRVRVRMLGWDSWIDHVLGRLGLRSGLQTGMD